MAATVSTGPGCPNPACGRSGTGARAPRRRAGGPTCSVPGWPGAATGWSFATWDRTMPTLIACLDRAMQAWGGAPTYWLTDNEATVSTAHVAGIAVRNPRLLAAASHYGVTVATCVPADPESKGGSEATVRVAKADLVPTEANLLDEYGTWAELVDAHAPFRTVAIVRRQPICWLRGPSSPSGDHYGSQSRPYTVRTALPGGDRKPPWSRGRTRRVARVAWRVPFHRIETGASGAEGDDVVHVLSRRGRTAHSGDVERQLLASASVTTPGHPGSRRLDGRRVRLWAGRRSCAEALSRRSLRT